MSESETKLLEARSAYAGRIVKLSLERVALSNGQVVELEIVHHQGAAAVVPVDDRGNVVLVRQLRWATKEWLWEVPAGTLDPGEAPETCAVRELREETGYDASRLDPLGPIWTTPGFTDERIWLFLARDLQLREQSLEPDELLSVEVLPLERAVAMALEGEIADAKSVCALFRAKEFLAGEDR